MAATLDVRSPPFLPGGGQMGALVRDHDWRSTPLGPPEGWPQALRSAAALVLSAPIAMIVLWGPDLIQIYNDAYAMIAGHKHPRALGQATRDCWPEVWDFNAPVYDAVLAGETRRFFGQLLRIERGDRNRGRLVRPQLQPPARGRGCDRRRPCHCCGDHRSSGGRAHARRRGRPAASLV